MRGIFKFWIVGLLGLVSLARACAAGAQPITVEINDTKTLFTASARFHGVNFVALWNSTGDSPGTLNAFAQMGQGLVRFPGGVPCQWYDWEQPLATGWTPLTPDRAYGLAKAGNAAMVFQTDTANDGSGVNKKTGQTYHFDSSGTHAAQWALSARQKGMEVAFWEIGNEPEMDAPSSVKQSQDTIYQWYNAKFEEQARAIKQAVPEAKVLGPAATNTWFWWAQHNLEKFLKAHGDREGTGLVDAISLHWYPEGGKSAWEKSRDAAQGWKSCMDYIQRAIRQYDTRPLPVYITEWNWGGGNNNSSKQLSNALGCADCIGMFLRTGVSGQTHFCLQHIDKNWGMLATKGESRPENAPSPTYFALALASYLGGEALETHNSADEVNVLSAYATRNNGGYQVMLINKSGATQTVSVRFQNLRPAGRRFRCYTLRGVSGQITDEDVFYNGVKSPQPALSRLPDPETRRAWDNVIQKLPPYSMAVLVFPYTGNWEKRIIR